MYIVKRTIVVMIALLMLIMAVPAVFAADNGEVDSSRLLELMNVAEKLRQEEFTAESWAEMKQAMTKAATALERGNQILIDDASRSMARALGEMKRMDFSGLQASLAAVAQWNSRDADTDALWEKLLRLTEQAQEARLSGDQERVDEIAGQINETLEQLKQADDDNGVSVIWIILFFVSLAVNVGFVVLVMIRTRNIRKYEKDDVPLVEYDIDDDIL